MPVCPVDLVPCARPSCRQGICEMADVPALALCWDCGHVHAHGVHVIVCVPCLREYKRATAEET
jgi:hypothetical protein